MENVKIISDNGVEININGLFYIFNSKYYFIYTEGEMDKNEYVKLYLVQVCKEVQNTPTGPVDTGYMLGMEISNSDEWKKVQESITKIVDDKKNGTKSAEIQYLPINMLVNLKIVSKNKFRLMKHIVEENFRVILPSLKIDNIEASVTQEVQNNIEIEPIQTNSSRVPNIVGETVQLSGIDQPAQSNIVPENKVVSNNLQNIDNSVTVGEVIIDYRAKFFEEQEKNKELQEQINTLTEKLENIKNIVG